MRNRKLLATVVGGLTTTGLLALPVAAHADDDVKVRAGSCSGSADYRMRLADAGDDPDRLRVNFFVNSRYANKRWTVRVYRGKTLVHRDAKRTNRYGNVRFADTIRGDDDRRIRVVARSAAGQTCKRTLQLDD